MLVQHWAPQMAAAQHCCWLHQGGHCLGHNPDQTAAAGRILEPGGPAVHQHRHLAAWSLMVLVMSPQAQVQPSPSPQPLLEPLLPLHVLALLPLLHHPVYLVAVAHDVRLP